MNAIQFLTDDKGNKVAVQIDLEKHKQRWEYFYDGLIVESRRREKDIPFEDVRKACAKCKLSAPRG